MKSYEIHIFWDNWRFPKLGGTKLIIQKIEGSPGIPQPPKRRNLWQPPFDQGVLATKATHKTLAGERFW
jgi:hypothetical protein